MGVRRSQVLDPSYNGHQVIATCRHELFIQHTMQEHSDIENRNLKSDLLEARKVELILLQELSRF